MHARMDVHPAQQLSSSATKRQKTDEHDGHIHGQLAAVDGAARDGADQVLILVQFVFGNDDFAFGGRDFGLGDKHLRHENRSR